MVREDMGRRKSTIRVKVEIPIPSYEKLYQECFEAARLKGIKGWDLLEYIAKCVREEKERELTK